MFFYDIVKMSLDDGKYDKNMNKNNIKQSLIFCAR